jgi:DNA polymerase elongation subunit (family B)
VKIEKLVVRQTLSRELERYHSPSPAALAAHQLADAGKNLRPGQSVRFIHTLGEPGVLAWDLEGKIDPRTVNVKEYRKLLLRAVETILTPFSMDRQEYCQPIPLPMFSEPLYELVTAG